MEEAIAARPYSEASSSSGAQNFKFFKVYVKGLVERAVIGIGIAICDGNDVLFESSKVFRDKPLMPELTAVAEGLDAALKLNLTRIIIFTDNQFIHQHLGLWVTSDNTRISKTHSETTVALSNQIKRLMRRFAECQLSLVTCDYNKSVKLARKALGMRKNWRECCTICTEDTYLDQMFIIKSCGHSYCFSCMSKHVQYKLREGILPGCPHDHCRTMLTLESSKAFLTPELLELLSERVKEASIPAEAKIYCPYPRCSTLLSKTELQRSVRIGNTPDEMMNFKQCPKCIGFFCIDCKVPWHHNMQCSEYKRQNPEFCPEDEIFKSLASQNLWRQCPKCNYMVSLVSGCYHISCRCGNEFCYTCGSEWKNKRATCKCPTWDERNLMFEQNRE